MLTTGLLTEQGVCTAQCEQEKGRPHFLGASEVPRLSRRVVLVTRSSRVLQSGPRSLLSAPQGIPPQAIL